MKRFTLVFLCLVMTLSLFACGKKQEEQSNDTATETQPTENQTQTDATDAKSTAFDVTISTPIATGITIVGGVCSSECEYVEVTGGAQTEKIYPDYNADGGYYIGQVKTTENCTLTLCEMKEENPISDKVEKKTMYREMENKMEGDEYMPVFGKNSRMHFYSAVLAYSLSDIVTDKMKDTAKTNIEKNVAAVKAANPESELIYLVVPSSASVYPETVPDEYPAATGETVYAAFSKIAADCGATVVYPLDTFNEHKNDKDANGNTYNLYHNTDSHWTTYGVYYGLSALMEKITPKFSSAVMPSVSDMGFHTEQLWGGDALFSFGDNGGFENYSKTGKTGETEKTEINELTVLYDKKMPTSTLSSVYRGMKSVYVDGTNSGAATVKNDEGADKPTALIMRDSFGCPAYDMTNSCFSTVYWQASHNYTFPTAQVKKNKPDYVIYMVSERNLLKVMLENSNATICSYAK